jgi:16S rRNA G966 N2-methylase RsmD
MELEVKTQNGVTHLVELAGGVQLHYEHSHGQLFVGDSIGWLTGLPTESADLVFADPPYSNLLSR